MKKFNHSMRITLECGLMFCEDLKRAINEALNCTSFMNVEDSAKDIDGTGEFFEKFINGKVNDVEDARAELGNLDDRLQLLSDVFGIFDIIIESKASEINQSEEDGKNLPS